MCKLPMDLLRLDTSPESFHIVQSFFFSKNQNLNDTDKCNHFGIVRGIMAYVCAFLSFLIAPFDTSTLSFLVYTITNLGNILVYIIVL